MPRLRILVALLALASCERAKRDAPPKPPPPPPRPSADIVIVLDLSKSMEEIDLAPNRLEATRRGLRTFVAASAHDRVGIVVFAQTPKQVEPLTTDVAKLDQAIAKIQIGDVPELGTCVGDGLALAVDELKPSTTTHKRVVFVGDGDSNWVIKYDPDQAAAAAKAAGIIVDAVLVGSDKPDGEILGAMSSNPRTLQMLAKVTGGAYYAGTDVTALERGLAAIRAHLDAL